jgi:hypothetical protein
MLLKWHWSSDFFDTGLEPVSLVKTNHDPGLVVQGVIVGGHIMGFPRGQYDTDGKAHGIAAEMDFGGEPTARTAKCLKLDPACFAGGAAMRPDRGAVDHLQRVEFTAAIGQPLQQDIPYA